MQWHTPIGYKVINGKITVYEEHRKIVEQIFKDYDSGISALHIVKSLKKMGIKNAKGSVSWTHCSVGKILENHNYLGTEYYPQIISEELFDRVQNKREQIRKEGHRGKYRDNESERLIFSGKLVCGECGSTYSHMQCCYGRGRYGVPKWKCKKYVYQNKVSCGGGFITDKQVEDVCVDAINCLIQNPGLVEKCKEEPQKISPECLRLERKLEQSDDLETDEMKVLLFERASERYKTLEVRDNDIRSAEMKAVLEGREEIEKFDEVLYRKLIKRIIVYKDNSVKVFFHNNNSVKIGY